MKYTIPLHIFFQYMEKDLCRGVVYFTVLCDHPCLVSLLFAVLVSLHPVTFFKCFFITCVVRIRSPIQCLTLMRSVIILCFSGFRFPSRNYSSKGRLQWHSYLRWDVRCESLAETTYGTTAQSLPSPHFSISKSFWWVLLHAIQTVAPLRMGTSFPSWD